MTPKLEKILTQAAEIIAAEFKEQMIEGNGETEDPMDELWEEYGYEELDDVSVFLDSTVMKTLKENS